MSLNVRTPPSTTYSPAPATPNNARLTALAVALETVKTALSQRAAAAPQAAAPGAPSNVSSFAPAEGAQDVAAPQALSDTQSVALASGMDPSLVGTPAGEAVGALGLEQQRLQKEMHRFPDHMRDGVREFNEKQGEHNGQVEEKLAKMDEGIAAERAKGGDGKKLKEMEEARDKTAKEELKPNLNPVKVVSEIEGVMNDPKIKEGDKKGKLEEVRNKYGLRESGGSLSMESFTNHLAQVREDSKSRVEGMQKSHMKELDAGIDGAKKTFGKDSPQVKALEEQKTGVDGLYSARAQQLKDQAHAVYHTYHHPSLGERIGNFFKNLGNIIAAPFKAIFNVVKGIGEGIGKFFTGDFGGAFKSVAGGFKNAIGNVVDGVKGLASNFGNLVSLVAPKAGEKINNFTTGLVDGVGNVAKGAFDTLTAIPQGLANGFTKLTRGDVAGAASAVGEGVKTAAETGLQTVKDGLPVLATAAAFVPGLQPIAIPLAIASSVKGAVEAGQRGDTLGVVASLAGGVSGGAGALAARSAAAAHTASAARWNNAALGADLVKAGANTGSALQNGDFFGAAGAAAGGVSRGVSAYTQRPGAATAAPLPPLTVPTRV